MGISFDYCLSESSLAVLMTKNFNFNNLGWEFEMKICKSDISEIYD